MNPTKFFVSPTALYFFTFNFPASYSLPPFQRSFFLILFVNREHGLFHPRYFENGPLEPGYIVIIVTFISKVVYLCF